MTIWRLSGLCKRKTDFRARRRADHWTISLPWLGCRLLALLDIFFLNYSCVIFGIRQTGMRDMSVAMENPHSLNARCGKYCCARLQELARRVKLVVPNACDYLVPIRVCTPRCILLTPWTLRPLPSTNVEFLQIDREIESLSYVCKKQINTSHFKL